MCRWMAYKGEQTFVDGWLLNSKHSLIEQSKSADMTKYEVNGDGFGIGWYGKRPEPGLFKSIRPAWNNANLKSLARNIESELFIAHVRAATGTPIQETNSHPFQYKNWLMVHNGLIHQFSRLKKDLIGHIDTTYFSSVLGSTDSEILFFLLLTHGLNQDVDKAVAKTIKLVEEVAAIHSVDPALRMTLGISDGKSLWCVRYSSHSNTCTLFYSIEQQATRNRVLVVSEPIDDQSISWTPVEENTIMHFDSENATHKQKINI